ATVLVIACPHALGLAIPLVIAISTTLGAQNGLLVKERLALERAREVNVVIFDKTGTLTRGRPVIVDAATAPESNESELLALAASVEADSEHPLARAIGRAAEERHLQVPMSSSFGAQAGIGARARVDGREVMVGGPRILADNGVDLTASIRAASEAWTAAGRTVLYAVADGRLVGALSAEDEIRP